MIKRAAAASERDLSVDDRDDIGAAAHGQAPGRVGEVVGEQAIDAVRHGHQQRVAVVRPLRRASA